MGIAFHCSYCGKKIEAPNGAGGKWGKCPSCHNKVYVPDLQDDEELKLAPIDESEEERKRRLMAETHRLELDILSEKNVPNEPATPVVPAPPVSPAAERELTKKIILYLRQMADGDLARGERTAKRIAAYGRGAVTILDKIALSGVPEPELADIPQQILSGLVRSLRNQIS